MKQLGTFTVVLLMSFSVRVLSCAGNRGGKGNGQSSYNDGEVRMIWEKLSVAFNISPVKNKE